jgi:hypothetical protein
MRLDAADLREEVVAYHSEREKELSCCKPLRGVGEMETNAMLRGL